MKIKMTLATPEIEIGENAKICYNTKLSEDGGKDITNSLVHKHKHLAVLRFAYATFKVSGISINAHVHFLRSSHLSFLVESKRYVNAKKAFMVYPKRLGHDAKQKMVKHWGDSIALYQDLINTGIKKEDARAILPTNTSTNLNVTGNLQAWKDFIKLRSDPHAQEEIREVALEIERQLKVQFPNVF